MACDPCENTNPALVSIRKATLPMNAVYTSAIPGELVAILRKDKCGVTDPGTPCVTLAVHDGETAGGFLLMRRDFCGYIAGSLPPDIIAAGSLTCSMFANNTFAEACVTAKFADQSIIGAKIKIGTLNGDRLIDGSVTCAKLDPACIASIQAGAGGGATTFLGLTDTPDAYAGSATVGVPVMVTSAGVKYMQQAAGAGIPAAEVSWTEGAQPSLGVRGGFAVSGGISSANNAQRSSIIAVGQTSAAITMLDACVTHEAPTTAKDFYRGVSEEVTPGAGTVRYGVNYAGTIRATNVVVAAADYAEWMESAGGEIPAGTTIVLENGFIRPATHYDRFSDVFGVVRPRNTDRAIVGNCAEIEWHGKWLRDEFGAPILDAEGNYQLSPEFDPAREYVPRSKRPEWNIVGYVGQVPMRDDQPMNQHWRIIRRLSPGVVLVLIR
jgi:hypothetical protein